MAEYQGNFLEQMQERYRELSGMRAEDASDLGIRFKILAEQMELLWQELDEVKQQSFAKTATGKSLELHAQQRGLTRKPALYAKGVVEFSRDTPAQEDIFIPKGVILTCQGMGSLRFVTTAEQVLQKGEQTVQAPVCCESPGKQGNLAAGQLNIMITPVPEITTVNNPQPLISGEDAESDESLRKRLMDSYHFVTNGTNSAFYYNKAMSYPGVSSAKVLPRVNGVGTVGIVIYGKAVNEELMEKMRKEIGKVKEINVDVTIEQAEEKPVEVSAEIAALEGYSMEDILPECQKAIEDYFEKQKIGKPVYPALLIRELLSCEGVANVRILSPAEELYPAEKEIFTLSRCSVLPMEQLQRREENFAELQKNNL